MAISRVLVALCLAFCISLSLALLEAERPYYDLYKDNRALEGLQTTELNGDVLLDPKSSLWNMQIQVRTLAKGTGERKKLHVGDTVTLSFISKDAASLETITDSEHEDLVLNVGKKREFSSKGIIGLQHHIMFCRVGDTCEFYVPWGIMNLLMGSEGQERARYPLKGTTLFVVTVHSVKSKEDEYAYLSDF